jgi:GNAT superfamily N-acetyltransferase
MPNANAWESAVTLRANEENAHPAEASYSFRLGDPRDVEGIVAFQRAHASEVEGMELTPTVVERGARAILEGAEPGFYLVAHGAGGALCACLLVLNEWSDWRAGNVWWIHSVYVAPSHRRRGLFEAMFNLVEAQARARGIRGLRLYVDKRNSGAKRVYARLGMDDSHYDMFEKML